MKEICTSTFRVSLGSDETPSLPTPKLIAVPDSQMLSSEQGCRAHVAASATDAQVKKQHEENKSTVYPKKQMNTP